MTVDLTERTADNGVPVIALTDSAFSPLSPKAAVKFEIAEADYAGFRSLSATFCVAMALDGGDWRETRREVAGRISVTRSRLSYLIVRCAWTR